MAARGRARPADRLRLQAAALAALVAVALTKPPPPGVRVTPDMQFAIADNELYVRINYQLQDRGYATLYGLLDLLRRRRVPDVYGSFTTVSSDFIWQTGAAASHFAFWRPPGAATPRLWPDWDFWGWPIPWVAPLQLVAAQMAAEAPPWRERAPQVFWKGTPWHARTGPGPRQFYAACARQRPDLFVAREVHWIPVSAGHANVSVMAPAWVKPVELDLRQLTRYKFVIYLPGLTWSTSLKRMLVSGAVLLLPAANPHESFVSEALRRCDRCALTYDLDDMCGSLTRALTATSDEEAARMAARLAAFARDAFSPEALREYMAAALAGAAAAQAHPGGALAALGGNYTRIVCAELLTHHKAVVGERLAWQLDEWFDDDCVVRNTTYLRYFAI